jgi:excisionase family DNA binding protein
MINPGQKIVLFPIPMVELENIIKECIKSEIQKAIPLPKDEDALITRKEAAKLLGVSLQTLGDYCKRGILVSFRMGTRVRLKRNQVLSSLQEVRTIRYSRKEQLKY